MENNEIKKEELLYNDLNQEGLDEVSGGSWQPAAKYPYPEDYCNCPECGQSCRYTDVGPYGKTFKCKSCQIYFCWVFSKGIIEITDRF